MKICNTIRIYLYVIFSLIYSYSYKLNGQVTEIYSENSWKFKQVMPILEKDKLSHYVFYFSEENDNDQIEIEFVITDLNFKEVIRGQYTDSLYYQYNIVFSNGYKVGDSIYLKSTISKNAEDNYIVSRLGISGALLYDVFSNDSPYAITTLEILRTVNLRSSAIVKLNQELHINHLDELTFQLDFKPKNYKKVNYFHNIIPINDNFLSIETLTSYQSEKVKFNLNKFDSKQNKLWSYPLKNFTNKNNSKKLFRLCKKINDKIILYSGISKTKENTINSIEVIDFNDGSLVQELLLNKFDKQFIGILKFTQSSDTLNQKELLISGPTYVDYNNQDPDGFYIALFNSENGKVQDSVFSWENLEKSRLSEKFESKGYHLLQNYVAGKQFILVFQKKNLFGYSDLLTVLLDKNLNIIQILPIEHSFSSKPTLLSNIYNLDGEYRINLFRKDGNYIVIKQLALKNNSLELKKNVTTPVSFDIDGVLEGNQSIAYLDVTNEKHIVVVRMLKL